MALSQLESKEPLTYFHALVEVSDCFLILWPVIPHSRLFLELVRHHIMSACKIGSSICRHCRYLHTDPTFTDIAGIYITYWITHNCSKLVPWELKEKGKSLYQSSVYSRVLSLRNHWSKGGWTGLHWSLDKRQNKCYSWWSWRGG